MFSAAFTPRVGRRPTARPVARHRVRRDAVQRAVLDADLAAPALQVMPLLLRLPARLTAPLPQQSHPIGFLELGALGVVRTEEERRARTGSTIGLSPLGASGTAARAASPLLEVPLADVAVGSHGVRDELDDAARVAAAVVEAWRTRAMLRTARCAAAFCVQLCNRVSPGSAVLVGLLQRRTFAMRLQCYVRDGFRAASRTAACCRRHASRPAGK